MSDNPITLEWDESGLLIRIDISEMDTLEGTDLWTVDAWPTVVGGKLSTTAAFELYEHVQDKLGEWAREGMAAQRAVQAGVTLNEYVGGDGDDPDQGLDPSDPKSPGYGDWLAGAADHDRKARRENG